MKKEVMIALVAIVLGLSLIIPLSVMGRKKRDKEKLIVKNGIEAVATVVRRTESVGNGVARTYSVQFDFFIEGKKIYVNSGAIGANTFNNAIIGMKYPVVYLESSPKKAVINLDRPIEQEYCNIERERLRIVETYSKKMLNNARSLDELGITISQKWE